ncbi:Nn.00g016750.m01.CDS01 [Neocucurbitaria sp. VM-36]
MDGWNGTVMAPVIDRNAVIGKKPNKIIPVPQEYRRVTGARERDTLVNDLKIETDCTIVPLWDQGMIYRFDIYGSGTGVEKAIRHLNQWISNAHFKSKDSSAWPKIPAFEFNEWYYDQVAEMEDDRTQMFKGPPPKVHENALKLPSVVIDWPEDLRNHPITPRDVFGNKLEALDKLRIRDEVFITLLPNNNRLWQVEIVGFDISNVEVAREHYGTLIERVRADTFGLQHQLNMILDVREGIDVVLEQAEHWWPNRNDMIVPRLRPSPMMYTSGSFRREGLHSTQLAMIQHAIQQALEAVRSKKGSYDFAVRLGCLALDSQKMPDDQVGKTFQTAEFLKAIDSRVDLVVKKWALDNELGGEVHRQLVAADHLLEPTKSAGYYGYVPNSLEQTRPIFRGAWVFRDPNSSVSQPATPVRHVGRPAPLQQKAPVSTAAAPPSSMFIVQIDWTDDEEGLYEKTSTKFYKLEPGKAAPKMNMDINLMELGESRGWYFALGSLIPVSRKLVSPLLTGFAERVAMPPKYDVNSTESFAYWDRTPTVNKHLQYARLDKIYSFGIQKTSYKVELTAMWYPNQKMPVWGLAVRHTEWAIHLAELERLPVGSKASWGHAVSTFLPDDGLRCASEEEQDLEMKHVSLDNKDEMPLHGIRILMEKLMQISEIVSSVTAARGRGGVSV